MITLATWLVFFHVLAALWLVAGAFSGAVLRAQIKKAGSLVEKVFGLRTAWRLHLVFTIPGAILVGLLGIDLIARRGYSMRELWIHVSLALYFVLLAVTLLYLTPKLKKTLRAGEASLEAGAATDEFRSLSAAKLPGILADVNALGIVVITLLMVLKPS